MKAKKILSRRISIANELNEIRRREKQLNSQADYLQRICNHEIVVKDIYKSKCKLLNTKEKYTHCFYCHEYLEPRKYMPEDFIQKLKKAVYIDISEMKDKITGSQLEDMYHKYKEKFPKASEYEIGQMMKKEIEKK